VNRAGLILATSIMLSAPLGSVSQTLGRDLADELGCLSSALLPPQRIRVRQTATPWTSGFQLRRLRNNFVSRLPSMEYPLGSQIEHLISAGIWVGAVNADGDTVVSTGAS